MELKLLEFYNAEHARDKILQELEERGFTSENCDAASGLGERIVDIILQECYPHFSSSEAVELEDLLSNILQELDGELSREETLDDIFDDFLKDKNDQNNIT